MFRYPTRSDTSQTVKLQTMCRGFKCRIIKKRKRSYEPRQEKTFLYICETKGAVTAYLINAFVFATHIVQPVYCRNPKFQDADRLLCLYRLVCVGLCRKPRRQIFSRRGSIITFRQQKRKTLQACAVLQLIYPFVGFLLHAKARDNSLKPGVLFMGQRQT